jgi:hypothetical protein
LWQGRIVVVSLFSNPNQQGEKPLKTQPVTPVVRPENEVPDKETAETAAKLAAKRELQLFCEPDQNGYCRPSRIVVRAGGLEARLSEVFRAMGLSLLDLSQLFSSFTWKVKPMAPGYSYLGRCQVRSKRIWRKLAAVMRRRLQVYEVNAGDIRKYLGGYSSGEIS